MCIFESCSAPFFLRACSSRSVKQILHLGDHKLPKWASIKEIQAAYSSETECRGGLVSRNGCRNGVLVTARMHWRAGCTR